MQSQATTVDQYIAELPEERQKVISQLRKQIKKNLPKGFEECMGYGMIAYVIPHSMYPAGYHCDPKVPVPFMSLASQKNFVAVYSMGLYADPKLLKWFTNEYAKAGVGKLDMGKSCIRFKKMDMIPFDLIGQLASKITPKQWLEFYEKAIKK
ncbi:MAG: DUF1801 domain-containing protein [Chitinophagaceae bacterium]|nr:DUF1801 domain-containing protein [Chitinophagaceae bacterium]